MDARLSATRSRLLLADGLIREGPRVSNTLADAYEAPPNQILGVLAYARAFREAPSGSAGDDLRWFIGANLVLLGQQLHELLPPLEGDNLGILADALSPDGTTYAAVGPDGAIRLWDPVTGRLKATLRNGRPAAASLRFSPDGRLLAASDSSDPSAAAMKVLGGGSVMIQAEPSRRRCASAVQIWDLSTFQAGPLIPTPSPSSAEFQPGWKAFRRPYQPPAGGS